jgi:hypothetical protein
MPSGEKSIMYLLLVHEYEMNTRTPLINLVLEETIMKLTLTTV